jgi:hypothetical protein
MSSNAITEKEERITDRPAGPGGGGPPTGPSLVREDEPTFPRTLGMIGAALVIVGGMALAFNVYGRSVRVSTGWSILMLAGGMAGLLFHAAFDRDVQWRRMYLAFGCALLALGVGLTVYPAPRLGGLFTYAVPCLFLALLFLLAFLRNETDAGMRNIAQTALGGVGALMAVVGLGGGLLRGDFLLPLGMVLGLLGLLYLAAFIASRGIGNDQAYYAALGLTAAGLVLLIAVLARSLISSTGSRYFVSYGSVLLLVGILYSAVGAGFAAESSLFVLTRRELGAFFFSPIAYLVLLGFTLVCWPAYKFFIDQIADPRAAPIEPIVRTYLVAWFPVIALILIVPLLTMRLLAEEQRTGTLEVLLTAPVDESVVVLSKFLAALITYLVMWMPFGLFLLAIPLSGGNPFDYRPLLSFLSAMIATGAAFMSMGLFFSSLTRNQIISFVLTAAGMFLLTIAYPGFYRGDEGSVLQKVLTHISYITAWESTLEGKIMPRVLLFPLSMTAVFLFLTVKVLESRKWR